MKILLQIGIWILAMLNSQVLFAAQSQPLNVRQTQSRVQELDKQIRILQHNLASAGNRQQVLTRELSQTEKDMGQSVARLQILQTDMQQVQKKMQILQEQISVSRKNLTEHEKQLAHQMRIRYQMGAWQPVKWLLNQENPYAVSRILTYYQYLLQVRQKNIEQIAAIHARLDADNKQLEQELASNRQLQQEQKTLQETLQKNKAYRQTLMESLTREIKTGKQSLEEAEKDRANLAQLLKTLIQSSSAAPPKKPFLQMRRKLPHPVLMSAPVLRKMNQGVTFFADEGVRVAAVYPGKIVFSDWLKGYGLLIIIDHGQGFMTLYAHNQALFRYKGQTVRQGDVIASVGHTGGLQQNGLYFEVRHHGKAVPPLEWFS